MKYKSLLGFSLLLFINFAIHFNSYSQICGTCTTPNCLITDNTTAVNGSNSSITSYNDCYTYVTPITSGTVSNCYTISTNANGILGFRLNEQINQNQNQLNPCDFAAMSAIDASRTYTLKLASDGCGGSSILPNVTNKNNSAIGFNPEWYSLLPNTAYVLCVTITIPADYCQLEEICMVGYHTIPNTPTCGTVGFNWQTGSAPSNLDCTNNTDYSLKANTNTIANGYIAPGFTINDASGNIVYSKIEIEEGIGTGFVNAGVQKVVSFCAPSLQYSVKLTGSGSGNVTFTDNATGKTIYTGVFSSGTTIILPINTILGSATFSGPGVSNNKKLSTTLIGSGYGVFNPFGLSAGPHTIRYDWNNGIGCSGFKEIVVNVTCAAPTCGTVGIDWVTPSPNSVNLVCTNNTEYALKANTNTIANGYIAPGFTINDASGNIVYSKIEIEEGIGTGFINAGVQKVVTYCSPSLQYSVILTGSGSGNVTFTDHATGKPIYTGVFSSGSTIILPINTILGSATFSGPGVSNNKKSYPLLIGSGYGVFNPSSAGPGTHTITYTWNNGQGCSGTDTKTVIVTGTPINPTFTIASSQCENSVATILQPTSNNSISGTWNPLTVSTATLGKTTYTFTPTVGQCATTETVDITINPNVIPTFTLTNKFCINTLAQTLPTTSDNSISGTWSPSSIITTTVGPTSYQFTPDLNQCASEISQTITVFENPIANAVPSKLSGKAVLDVNFTNLSTNAPNLNWDFGNGTSSNSLGNTSSSYTNVGNYNITLLASNGVCPDNIWKTIITVLPIDPLTFNIPNIFTPNNDGVNDQYFIELENAASFEAIIFNRWGNEMISQNKINEKWDGKSASGKMSDDGVYFIKYKIIGLDKSVKEGVASFQLQN